MDFSKETVTIVAYLVVFHAMPATEIADLMQVLYNVKVSHDSVTRWNHKCALNLHRNLGPLNVPYSRRKRLFTDESQFSIRGQKRWVWAAKESKHDSIQSFFLSPRRSTEYARSTFNIALHPVPGITQSQRRHRWTP